MNFDASMLVVVAIFGIAYFLLKLFVFDPLLRILKSREARVEGARSTWQEATTRAEEALADERRRLLAARRDSAARRDLARREAQEQRRAALEAAKGRLQEQLEGARQDLAAQVEREERELEGRAGELAARISERLVGRAV